MHNYWLLYLHRESQTLTPIFLLKHNYSSTWLTYYIVILQNYYKESSLFCPMIFMKVFIISLLNIYHFGTNFVCCNCFLISSKNLSEEHEHKVFFSQKWYKWSMREFLQKFTNSQINLSEAREHFFKNTKAHRA